MVDYPTVASVSRIMPNGLVHRKTTLMLAICTTPVLVMDWRALPVIAGELSGMILSPDLDLKGVTDSEKLAWRISKPLGWLFFAYFYPYAKCNKHRGVLHDTPVIGTFVRAVYLLWIPLALLMWVKCAIPWDILGWWFVGLCLADILHIIMDRMW